MWHLLASFMLLSAIGPGEGVSYVFDHMHNMLKSVDFADTVPQVSRGVPLEVELSLAVNRVVSVDDVKGELVADGVLSMRWIDVRTAWDPWNSNMQTMVWPDPAAVWTPDVLVLNGFGSEFDTSPEASALLLTNLGNVTWCRRLRMRVPYDAASASSAVTLASWSHSSTVLTLRATGQGVELSDYQTSGSRGYTVTSGAVTKSTKTSSCMTSPVDVITFNLSVAG